MSRMFLMLLGMTLCLSTVVTGQDHLHFRGKLLTFRHYVYGKFNSAAGRSGTVNLGYAHGVMIGQELAVLRPAEGKLLPMGVLRLTDVRAGDAYGRFESDYTLDTEDLVLVSARDLNLWRGRSRIDQVTLDTLYIRSSQRGYDTGSLSPELMKELGHDDDLMNRRVIARNINAINPLPDQPIVKIDRTVRGAFRPANSIEGLDLFLSPRDKELARDQPTLNLETGLARFVLSNAAGRVEVSPEVLQSLARHLSEDAKTEDVQQILDDNNGRIRHLIQPR